MGRRMKEGRYVNVNIRADAFEALERHCAESGQTKTVAIERAVMACYGARAARGAMAGLVRPAAAYVGGRGREGGRDDGEEG